MYQVTVAQRSITPSKVVCIGRNYVDHINELGNEIPQEMVVFVKPNSAISDSLSSFHQEPLHYEGELCFVYEQGRFSAVGFGLDLTKRQLQSSLKTKGLPWERAKAFDGSAVFSEFVEIDNVNEALSLQLVINDDIAQQGGVELMMHKPAQILEELRQFMTLCDGDIVMTGTPKGVGEIKSGALFSGTVFQGDKPLTSQQWQAK